jgi:hypothetical protein
VAQVHYTARARRDLLDIWVAIALAILRLPIACMTV